MSLSFLLTGEILRISAIFGGQTVRSCILPAPPPGTKALGWGMRMRGFQTQQNLFPLVRHGERATNGRRVCGSPNATLPSGSGRNSVRKHLLGACHCSEYFTHANSFNLPINLESCMVMSYPLYRWEKQATKTLRSPPKVTQLAGI